ncbi:cache domain-containing sensor histidine kinase [Cohnella thailandensis]|uniref:histidine kinase n=1 Tax=Cohnella thailandensis TaxID=557557 RepID=A0A841T481_9BACL|nr:histidine kinase [Cohnella thailandensis]MBB6637158.1 sensor histidine kinase [Cohnella thailandensis]MBP1977024.1 two-component system sensor histidine kinase YesM [Cohnella thailandensis]
MKSGTEWMRRAVLRIRNLKFQNKLMASYLLACVIPLALVSAILFRQSAAGLEESSQEFAALYTSQIKSSLNEFLKEYDKVTKSVLVDNELIYRLGDSSSLPIDEQINRQVAVQRMLMRVALLKPEIGTVMLISRNNGVYQYTNTTSKVNENLLLSRDWYEPLSRSEDTFVITGLHDRSYYEDKGAGAMVTVGRLLYSSDGAYAGLLLIDLDPFSLLPLDNDFVQARNKYGMNVIIRNKHDQVVYDSDAASGRLAWEQVLEFSGTREGGPGDRAQDRIRLTGSTSQGELTIQTEIPRAKLLQKINRIKGTTLILILTSCVIVALLSLGLSYTITKPIKALRRSMKQAEVGQYLPIEKKQANDEIGSLVNSYNKMIVTIRTLINDVYLGEIKQRQAKLVALQNQINPHMLYNTLESIRMNALVKDDDETADMIKILARMFRIALGKDGRRHSIRSELEYTAYYLKLQNIRFDNMFNLEAAVPDEMMDNGIVPLIFQPIVENTVNHGFEGYDRMIDIVIEGAWTEEGDIRIRISDNGAGIPPDKLAKLRTRLDGAGTDKSKLEQAEEDASKGLGLTNIAERIKLHYGDLYYLTILHSDKDGTTIEMLIPKGGISE